MPIDPVVVERIPVCLKNALFIPVAESQGSDSELPGDLTYGEVFGVHIW